MALFHRHAEAVLTSVSWERSIDVEQEEWEQRKSHVQPRPGDGIRNVRHVQETHWADRPGVPAGGIPQQVLETRTVWRYEERDSWPSRTVRASGTSQADVHWPSYTLMDDECVEARHAVYVAVFEEPQGEGPGKTRKAELDEATWRTLEVGASYHLELGPLGGVKAVTPAAAP